MNALQLTCTVLACATLSAPSLHAATLDGSIRVQGVERRWQLHVPASYQKDRQYPLVLDFHGTGGSPQNQSRSSGFTILAEEKGFLVVNPAGKYVRTPNGGATWNVDLDVSGVDDVRFVRELIAHLQSHYSIDPARIYATGFSGGARMSSRLACDLSELIAAVGPVGGIRFPERCVPTHPVAIMAIHAEDDEVNHFVHRSDSPGYWPEGVMPAMMRWSENNGCPSLPREQRLAATAVELAWERCRPGSDIVLVKLANGGHTWPGSTVARERVVNDFHATRRLWAFFETHPRK